MGIIRIIIDLNWGLNIDCFDFDSIRIITNFEELLG